MQPVWMMRSRGWAGRLGRREVRLRARRCLEGLLSDLERRTGWSLAEYAGETSPDGMQRLFTTARWDPEAVQDDLRRLRDRSSR